MKYNLFLSQIFHPRIAITALEIMDGDSTTLVKSEDVTFGASGSQTIQKTMDLVDVGASQHPQVFKLSMKANGNAAVVVRPSEAFVFSLQHNGESQSGKIIIMRYSVVLPNTALNKM